MADTATGMLPPLGDDGRNEQQYLTFSPDGQPTLMTWRRNAPMELRLDRYGDGRGVYLDPAEQAAAQATAELLFRIRRAAGERVALMAAARRRGVRRPGSGARHG